LVGNGPIAAFAAVFEHLRRRDGLIVRRSSSGKVFLIRDNILAQIIHEFTLARSASEGWQTIHPRLRFGLVFRTLR
jgi:hypothetical protein